MSNKEFRATMKDRIEELVDLYVEKYKEVHKNWTDGGGPLGEINPDDSDEPDPDTTDIESVVEALASGDPDASDGLIQCLDRVAVDLGTGGVEQEVNAIQGRAEDWTGAAAVAFYDYLTDAQIAVANQLDMVQALNVMQQAQRDVILAARDDALKVLDGAIELLKNIETESDGVSFLLTVLGALALIAGTLAAPATAGTTLSLTGIGISAINGASAAAEVKVKNGGDPEAVFTSVAPALEEILDSTESELEKVEKGLKGIVHKVETNWQKVVPKVPDLGKDSDLDLPA